MLIVGQDNEGAEMWLVNSLSFWIMPRDHHRHDSKHHHKHHHKDRSGSGSHKSHHHSSSKSRSRSRKRQEHQEHHHHQEQDDRGHHGTWHGRHHRDTRASRDVLRRGWQQIDMKTIILLLLPIMLTIPWLGFNSKQCECTHAQFSLTRNLVLINVNVHFL